MSGHKKVETIQSYSNKTTKAQKRQMSETLSSAIIKSPLKKSKTQDQGQFKLQCFKALPQKLVNDAGNFNLNIRDLLELSEQEEEDLLKDLFNEEIPMAVAVNNNKVSQCMPVMNAVRPKMVFENSTITINFNLK